MRVGNELSSSCLRVWITGAGCKRRTELRTPLQAHLIQPDAHRKSWRMDPAMGLPSNPLSHPLALSEGSATFLVRMGCPLVL